MKITPNFDLKEFACKDGTPVPEKYMYNVILLAQQLQVIRDAIGKPIKINSAYRTPTYNKSVGGASKSQHLTASAADLNVSGLRPTELKEVIEGLIAQGKILQGGVGLYNNFVHYDIYFDGKNVRRWDLRK